ncbi:MAG: hypothetical protein WCA81_09050 [Rhizomicrobium sp.]
MNVYALTWTQASGSHPERESLVSFQTFASIGQWNVVNHQLSNFAKFEENWDGLGSDKPKGRAIEIALECLKTFRALSAPAPSVATLSPDGSISVEWRSHDEYLQAEFSSEPRVELVKFGPNRVIERWSVPLKKRDPGNYTWVSFQPTETGESAVSSVAMP